MKKVLMIVGTLALLAISGCYSNSEKGGSVLKGEEFKISVPTFTTEIKQGEIKNVTVMLERGQNFKQDVKLRIKASPGISVVPTKVWVEASEAPEVQLQISAAKDAALGEYQIFVKGTPENGASTSTEFNVKVVAP